jgi:hypothetical protein
MPTNKVESVVLNTAAEGETKPKRVRNVRKPAVSNPPAEEAVETFHQPTTPAKRAPRRKASSTKAAPVSAALQESETRVHVSLSTEDISVRAYFIGEHRRSLGLVGDSEADWLEAERQLRSEALGIAASLRKK